MRSTQQLNSRALCKWKLPVAVHGILWLSFIWNNAFRETALLPCKEITGLRHPEPAVSRGYKFRHDRKLSITAHAHLFQLIKDSLSRTVEKKKLHCTVRVRNFHLLHPEVNSDCL